MKKEYFINLGLLAGTVILFFGILEVGLRVTGIQGTKPKPLGLYQKSTNATISYELKSGISQPAFRSIVKTNSLGFRSPEVPDDQPMIVVLGDSIAFGYGVENDETIAARLDALLPEYFVLNAATPGYNIEQEIALYREKVAPLDPEILILIFHPNDVDSDIGWLDDEEILRSQSWKPGEETCSPITRGILGLVPGKCWLSTHSALYKAMERFVNTRHGRETLAETQVKSQQNLFEDDITDEDIAWYREQLSILTRMLPTGMPRLFVIWPDRFVHFVSRPKLAKVAEDQGFEVLDLHQIFGNQIETLGWDTVHPSAASAERVANILKDILQHFDQFKNQ